MALEKYKGYDKDIEELINTHEDTLFYRTKIKGLLQFVKQQMLPKDAKDHLLNEIEYLGDMLLLLLGLNKAEEDCIYEFEDTINLLRIIIRAYKTNMLRLIHQKTSKV